MTGGLMLQQQALEYRISLARSGTCQNETATRQVILRAQSLKNHPFQTAVTQGRSNRQTKTGGQISLQQVVKRNAAN